MFAVLKWFENGDVVSIKMDAEEILGHLNPNMDIDIRDGYKRGVLVLCLSEEEADSIMKS